MLTYYIDLAKPKSGACIFFPPHVSRAQRLYARTRTQVVQLRAQCTDYWTTEQSCGIGVPAVQLTTHVKSSTLYSRTSKFFRLNGLLLFCIIMGLCFASSTINVFTYRLALMLIYVILEEQTKENIFSLCFCSIILI